MLVKPAYLQPGRALQLAGKRLQRAGDQLGERRLAGAVDPEQADAVVQVEPQVQPFENRRAVSIAGGDTLQPHQRRRQRTLGGGQEKRGGVLDDHRRHRRQLGQHLQARLGLGRLRRFGAEPVDEGLKVGALRFDLGLGGFLQAGLFLALALELVVAADIQGQLAVEQVQDVVAAVVQDLAVVADDHRRIRVFLQPAFQPERAFQVEVVGRFVQQQQVRLGEQRGGQGHPHAPPARELRHRAGEVIVREAEAGENFRRPARRAVGADFRQPTVDVAHPLGIGGLQLVQQRGALLVGGQHRVDQRHGGGRMFLIDRADAGLLRIADLAVAGVQLVEDQLEQRGLAHAVASDQADLGAHGYADARMVEEAAAPGVEGKVVDLQHGRAGP